MHTTAKDGPATQYGRRKLDADAYQKQQAANVRRGREGVSYGARKFETGKPAPVPAEAPAPAPSEPLAWNALLARLKADPAYLDQALDLELGATPPRRGALLMMLGMEKKKPEPRAEVIARIEGALS